MLIMATMLSLSASYNLKESFELQSLWLLIFATYLSFMLVFYYLFSASDLPFLTSLFVLFNFLFFFLTPLSVISSNSIWFVNRLSSQHEKMQSMLILYFILIVSNIVIVVSSRKHPKVKATGTKPNSQISISRLNIIAKFYIIGLLGLIIFAPSILLNLLPQNYSNPAIQNVALSSAQFGLSRALLQTTPVVLAICFLRITRLPNNERFIRWGYFFSLLSFLFSLPLGSSRQMFLFSFIPIMLAIFESKNFIRQILITAIPLIAIFGQQFTFAITHSYGEIRKYGYGRFLQNMNFNVSEILLQGDFDSFGMFTLGLKSIENGLNLFPFTQFLGVFFFWVPRFIWNDKPFDTSIEIARFNNLSFQNLSAPWVLELLVNGGFILLVVGTVYLTLRIIKLDALLNFSDRSWIGNLLLAGSFFILLRGSLLQASGVVVYAFFLVIFLTRKKDFRKMDSKIL